MHDWWDHITKSDDIFDDNNFYCAFPKSKIKYIDDEINDKDIEFPQFDKNGWDDLSLVIVMMDETVICWDGSYTNRMEICYLDDSDWYFICKQNELFFSVSIINGHPEVHCNNFVFCNSHGSSYHTLDLNKFKNPYDILKYMFNVAIGFLHF